MSHAQKYYQAPKHLCNSVRSIPRIRSYANGKAVKLLSIVQVSNGYCVDFPTPSFLLVVIPWLYITRRYTWNTREQATPALAERVSRRKHLTWFIALHSTLILYNLCVNWPADLFSFLKAPLNASSDALRSRLLSISDAQTLPERLSMLLVKLSSSEARHAYLRYAESLLSSVEPYSWLKLSFGHNVVQDCDYCHSYYDYLLYWFPKPLLEYVREIAIVGIVTVQNSGHERWRARAVTVLAIAGVIEAYFVVTSTIIIPQDGKDVFRVRSLFIVLISVFEKC